LGGKWKWGGKGEGGRGQFTSNLGPEWTGIAPHAKEGFQVSKRDSGTGEGSSGRRGIIKGVIKGLLRELCHVLSYNVKPVYIVLLCVCRANKISIHNSKTIKFCTPHCLFSV
jgi:hypothetical protein